MAVANYHFANGHYPPAYLADENGRPMHSWRVLLLPFMEERELYEQYDFSQPWNSAANLRLETKMPAVYAFHGSNRAGNVTTNYLAVVGESTMWPGSSYRRSDEVTVADSHTILLVENLGQDVHWMEPRDLHFDAMSFEINSPQGVSSKYAAPAVATLVGHVRQLNNDLPPEVLRAMLTLNSSTGDMDLDAHWKVLPDGRSRDESASE